MSELQVAGSKLQVKRKIKSYRDLDIYHEAHALGLEVHRMTLKLPPYEIYETGSQVRRSSKSVSVNIVEGFGRRRYKAEFIRFLIHAHSSCDETIEHLRYLQETGPLSKESYDLLMTRYEILSKRIHVFIESVERGYSK
jgi:four helix bundle protein